MRILVDGDGCAGRGIIEQIAEKNSLELMIICDLNHAIHSQYGEVKYVDSGYQSVDMVLVNYCKDNDIVVTQDYGLAAMCMAKKARCIGPSGYIYEENNIDNMLMQRHIYAKIRRGGGKTPNAKKRMSVDDERLKKNLTKLIEKYKDIGI